MSSLWVFDGLWRPLAEKQRLEENSKTDYALMEEASRYRNAPNFFRPLVCVSPSPPSSFSGRTPSGEYYDRSGRFWTHPRGNLQAVGRLEGSLQCWRLGEEAERYYARKRVPDFSCPMKLRLEMKIQTMSKGVVRSLGFGRFLDWGAMGAQGSAGGILVCWDKRSLELLEMEVGRRGRLCGMSLGAIRGIWDEPWCLGGDFNVTLSQRERSRQGSLNGAMRRFAQVVDDLDLIDLPLQGGGGMSQGPSPFRFENMWLKVDGFKDLLRDWWQEGVRGGRASFRIAAKMKVMKEKIKAWNRDVFGRLEVNKSSALQQIEFWDRVECDKGLSEEKWI
ncbi:hypothetical protein CK203_043344 [Vitis vinifera]|uniref:Uncharacterized protein n=1 Tax=Vitis vinifera TaxID=29760 RepID=A0A438GY93_VITVI|nr:hypothetical protein CK203_043344 [Vitis vinifera]